MLNIGDICIPTVSELSSKNAEKEDYLVMGLGSDHIIPVRGRKTDANPILIRGLLYQKTDDPKNAEDYAEDLMALEERNSVFNYINSSGTRGFLTNIQVSVPHKARSGKIREYEIKGKFFPYSAYQHALTYRGSRYDDAVYYCFPRYFTLPSDAYNVHLASTIDIIPLAPRGYIGTVPIYRPFPVLNHSNYYSLTGTLGSDPEAMDGTTITLNATGEAVSWKLTVGKDIPRGAYKVKFRAKESTSVQDIQLDIVGSVSGSIASLKFTGPDEFLIYETSTISFTTHEEVTVTVTKLNAPPSNVVVIDYVGFNTEFSVLVVYDTVSEYNNGEVKIFDTVTHGETDSSKWKRIYSIRHIFTGDMIFQNDLMQWRIDQTKNWEDTGDLIVNSVEKVLFPITCRTEKPDIRIVSFEPTYIELEIIAVGIDIMTTRIIIDPLMFRFEVDRAGTYGFYWTFTTAGIKFIGWKAIFAPDDGLQTVFSLEDHFMFALVPESGFTTVTYQELLFDAFNKPTITGYISKRMI
jgi:hypothetical protein